MNRKKIRLSTAVVFSVGFLALTILDLPGVGQTKQAGKAPQKQAKPAGAAPSPTPIAAQDHEVEGVEVALLSAKRNNDGTVTIRWQYRNKTSESKKLAHGAAAGLDSQRFAKDAHFTDPKGRKYPVLKGDNYEYVASKHKNFEFGITLAPKQSVTTWARFSAPPPGTEKITVYLPGAPPFEDVEIPVDDEKW